MRSIGSFATLILSAVVACAGESDETPALDADTSGTSSSGADATGSPELSSGTTSDVATTDAAQPGESGEEETTTGDEVPGSTGEPNDSFADESSGGGETGTALVDDCTFEEDFEGVADGEPWPDDWIIDGGVAVADVQGGRGRLQAVISGYSVARISVRLECSDVDAAVTFQFTDASTQGAALYARTNGGYLEETDPPGEGYAGFAELFRNPGALGAWREFEGVEQMLTSQPFPMEPGVDYRLRFRITQQNATESLLQSKIWVLGEDEPEEWLIERLDDTASLQGVSGGIALDAWSSEALPSGEGADVFFDDLVVRPVR